MLHERIKEERNKKGMSQKELGDMFQITQQAVGSWETGKSVPDAVTLSRLADFFGVSTDFLLGRNAPPARPRPTQAEKDEILRLFDTLSEEEQTAFLKKLLLRPKKEDK